MNAAVDFEVAELGYFMFKVIWAEKFVVGDVGYIIVGIKDVKFTRVGDTVTIVY